MTASAPLLATASPAAIRPTTLHADALKRMNELERGGVLRADWHRAMFIHLEVDADILQAHVPFELDLYHGRAFVSLVAFDMTRFRFRGTGTLGALALAPVARHGLLNIRTYVRHNGEAGIVFLSEWIPNRLSVLLGPRTYGLPYRFGRLRYGHDPACGRLNGEVTDGPREHRLRYLAPMSNVPEYATVAAGSLDEFLIERYTAFTKRKTTCRVYRIWHEPWQQIRVAAELEERSLLSVHGPWLSRAPIVTAHYSPGAMDVWIGRPHVIR